ncbi:MAG: Gfo/Idh/MocA family oxidoreductase [Candidatus Hydrogenedentes bacterium]|nr:Gfo/Idh/MocA family oxidoreductase [Candidatus Hydrogenedentota bacterium]
MSDVNDVSRRDFLRGAAQTAAGVSAGAAAVQTAQASPGVYKRILPQTVIGANEKILTGHIGVGNMGIRDLEFVMFRDAQDIQPIVVCDLFPRFVDMAVSLVTNGKGKGGFPAPATTPHFEDIINNKDVDAVVVVTPDHWHTIPTLMAIDAGKDVYCEKPLCTTMEEAIALRTTIKASQQVYQSGTMQRSGKYFQEAVDLIQKGYIGKVRRVECWNHDDNKIEGIGKPTDAKPEWLDWDRYIGWTQKVPYNKNRYIYNFRWFTEYSGGKITDWGTHLLDIAIWAMGEDKSPKSVTAAGGNLILQDNRTTPDTLDVFWEFDDYILSFSNRAWCPDWWQEQITPEKAERQTHGIYFHGTLGTMRVDRKGYAVYPFGANGKCDPVSKRDAVEADMNNAHWANFADCVRARQQPICNIDVAFQTAKICLTGKCAYLASAKLDWDDAALKFAGNDAEAVKVANDWAYRPYQNGWSLQSPYFDGWKV